MLRNIWAITVVTCKDSLRNRLLCSILFLAVFLSILNIFVGQLFSYDLGKVSVEFGLSVTSLTGLLVLFYQGMKVFVDDLEKHTIYMTMSRPVSYGQFVFGKFSGLGLVLLVIVIIFSLFSAISIEYFLRYYPGFVPVNFSWINYGLAYFFKWLVLLIVLSISLFWFAFARQPIVAILLTFMSYLVGYNLSLVRGYIETSGPETSALQLSLLKGITWIFPNLSFFDLNFVAAYGLPLQPVRLVLIGVYGVSMIALFLSLATFFFKRKELM